LDPLLEVGYPLLCFGITVEELFEGLYVCGGTWLRWEDGEVIITPFPGLCVYQLILYQYTVYQLYCTTILQWYTLPVHCMSLLYQ